MNVEIKDLLINCIKTGDLAIEPQMSLQRMMYDAGMSMYTPICRTRIIDAGLVDGNHVSKDHEEPKNLFMDIYGIRKCKEILGAYVQPAYLDEVTTAFQYANDITVCSNNVLYILRTNNKKMLRAIRKEAAEKLDKDAWITPELVDLELKHRNTPLRKTNTLRKRFAIMRYVPRLYKGPISFLPHLLTISWKLLVEDKIKEYDRGIYSRALIRFQRLHKHHKRPERLHRDELIKYVYLGVKALGKEYLREHKQSRIKSYFEIEKQYKECSPIMKAIGLLTPTELMQMFPVDKEYDGERYESKDYFYTMNVIRKMNPNAPIGNEYAAASLMWDYENNDVRFFMLNWMNGVDDLNSYCNQKGPHDAFYGRLERKEY